MTKMSREETGGLPSKSATVDTLLALCKALDRQPRDIMEYVPEDGGTVMTENEILVLKAIAKCSRCLEHR